MKITLILITLIISTLTHASEISGILGEIQDLVNLSDRVKALEETQQEIPKANPYQFILQDKNGDGFVDEEWEEIIEQGQAIQAKVWTEKEAYWTEKLGAPPANQFGWYGTATMPVIQIVCLEGEYFFHNTARLPGRFQITCPARWGATLRFYGDGDKVLVDDIAYGIATNAPIGIYVEPKTEVTTVNGTMIVKPFEQTIERVIIVAMKGVMPIYLAQNQDRFLLSNCNIQQHQGAQIGVKHGPPLQARDYPFSSKPIVDGNTYLADPVIKGCQFEGPHNNKRPQAAIFMSGNNMQYISLNLYGWMMGIYAHGGQGRIIAGGFTIHHGGTADGRQFCSKDEILTHLFSVREGNNEDSVSGVAGGFKGWILPKRSRAPDTAGWHNKGEAIF